MSAKRNPCRFRSLGAPLSPTPLTTTIRMRSPVISSSVDRGPVSGKLLSASCGRLVIRSDFDSGNLSRVKVIRDTETSAEIKGVVAPDMAGTEHKASIGTKRWFYFTASGGRQGVVFQVTLVGMNKDLKRLFEQCGHTPLTRITTADGQHGDWHRGCEEVITNTGGGKFGITFQYRFQSNYPAGATSSFAFCYPFTYTDCQDLLNGYSARFLSGASSTKTKKEIKSSDSIYFHREVLINSIENRRVDLLTVSSWAGIMPETEPRLEHLFPDESSARARMFEPSAKQIFFISSRVHPGETPASHVLNGFLEFILREDDPRSQALRAAFVFKIVPMINPDGVVRGHMRCDSLGENLNRVYMQPDRNNHPAVYSIKRLLEHHCDTGALKFYIDLHAHGTKRGCFLFGNTVDGQRQIDNVTYAHLVALNTGYLDVERCVFDVDKMFSQDDRNGDSKGGSGRVGIFLTTNLAHCYTLECNYATGRMVNRIPLATGVGAKSVEPPPQTTPVPMYTPEIYMNIGMALAVAALDLKGTNPCSRLPRSKFKCLEVLQKHVMEAGKFSDDLPKEVLAALAKHGRKEIRPLVPGNSEVFTEEVDEKPPSRVPRAIKATHGPLKRGKAARSQRGKL